VQADLLDSYVPAFMLCSMLLTTGKRAVWLMGTSCCADLLQPILSSALGDTYNLARVCQSLNV